MSPTTSPTTNPTRRPVDRLAASRGLRGVLLAAYLLLVLHVLSPALLGPISGDDRVWVLKYPPANDGSVLEAVWNQVRIALEFSVQDRATALAFAERSALATATMDLAVRFGIVPVLIWALVKLALVALGVAAAVALCRSVRYRDATGEVCGLSSRTVSYVALAMPLLIACGVKTADRGGFNGWNSYPTLCLGMFPGVLLIVVVALRLHGPLARDYARWAVPVGLLFAAWGVVVAFSFELLVVAIPTVGVAMLLHPRPTAGGVVHRWRAPVTIAGAFGLSWLATYVAIKVAIGARACAATDSCYQGTLVEVRPRTVLTNLLAGLPIGTGRVYAAQSRAVDGPHPGLGAGSVATGVLAVLLLLALLWLRHRRAEATGEPASPAAERRGLVVVGVLVAVLGLASGVLTGVTQLAVERVLDTRTAYHVGPVVWTSVALLVAVVLRGLWLARSRWWGVLGVAVTGLAVVAVVAVVLPRNQLATQVSRREAVFSDFLQREVALGEPGRAAEQRRCTELRSSVARMPRPLDGVVQRQLVGAYQAYAFYHSGRFCRSTTLPELMGSS